MWPRRYSEDVASVNRDLEEMRRWERIVGRPSSWEVVDIWLSENYAKVHVDVGGSIQTSGTGRRDVVEKTGEYWVFDSGNSYVLPIQLDEWNQEKAVHVPLREIRERGPK